MKLIQKNFYIAFNVLYEAVKDGLGVSQKEEFYRLLFGDVYLLAHDDLYDNDKIRKVTAGNNTIHRRVVKWLYTDEGFEVLRCNIAKICLSKLSDKAELMTKMLLLLEADTTVPNNIKKQITDSMTDSLEYQMSRAIAAILVCLNHSDYICNKGNGSFFDGDFMRLNADRAIPSYPRYISDSPDAGVEELIGREDELIQLSKEITGSKGKMMVSAVGGLGKTELVKKFLHQIANSEITTNGIEMIAWIAYNNHNIRLSIKHALHLQCDLDEVWLTIQNMASKYGKRLLIVVDNIENVERDEYLRKLSSLQCRILVTSRQKFLTGFNKVMYLKPLELDKCRNLFYKYYQFAERDNEVVNDIIGLTAKLTIMVVFIAKVAFLEGMRLGELYVKLLEKGFKLSNEDVSCEHEKLQHEETIIQQMCILFTIVNYNEDEKRILTYISTIPSLRFDYSKAKKWFQVKKNSSLLKLFSMGILEHAIKSRTHIYWMHSVIAAAIREQQKDKLYELSRPFITILSEELDAGPAFGKEYEKADLIPFSWSVADIMEKHWKDERDTDFLTNLFHLCFACSNYALCEKLIDIVITVQKDIERFSYIELVYSYRNKIDMLLQFDRASEAAVLFEEVEKLFDRNNATENDRAILNSQYGILYQILGDYQKARVYFNECIMRAEKSNTSTYNKEISTAYTNMARMLVDSGDYFEAYEYIKKAIEIQGEDDKDSDLIICYSTLGSICTELMNAGHGVHFVQEAKESFQKVIEFREKYLGKHHADTAVAYHDYAYFLYIIQQYDSALKYNEMARSIEEELFDDYSMTRMRNLNTKALIIWEQGHQQEANEIFEYIIKTSEKMSADYRIDVADFEFNYARCLYDQGEGEKAIEMYCKCIAIWSEKTVEGNRKLAMAYQECADIQFCIGKISEALANYRKAVMHITEDFYLMVDVMDSTAACFMLSGRIDESIQTFKNLLLMLVEYNATDSETKFQLCNNLCCILDAVDEVEQEVKESLIEQIKDDLVVMEYVNNFFTNIQEK